MQRETLFVALTRPALTYGVPFEGFILNIVVVYMAGLEFGGPGWRCFFFFWLAGIPIHYLMRELTGWDPMWAHTIRISIMTAHIRVLEALPWWPAQSASEIESSV